jgi:hypothetical protein
MPEISSENVPVEKKSAAITQNLQRIEAKVSKLEDEARDKLQVLE